MPRLPYSVVDKLLALVRTPNTLNEVTQSGIQRARTIADHLPRNIPQLIERKYDAGMLRDFAQGQPRLFGPVEDFDAFQDTIENDLIRQALEAALMRRQVPRFGAHDFPLLDPMDQLRLFPTLGEKERDYLGLAPF